ncbi:MAG: hypothetical protein KatS3mg083_133 [Candidatus Dojkabacteria bacterium]|nr:MAG: hypothetical protein KatS3mg083_133 [Candidatus Dojkabacteria bacterium]
MDQIEINKNKKIKKFKLYKHNKRYYFDFFPLNETIGDLITLVAKEDPYKPYSDKELSELLNIPQHRVCKFRNLLSIPNKKNRTWNM